MEYASDPTNEFLTQAITDLELISQAEDPSIYEPSTEPIRLSFIKTLRNINNFNGVAKSLGVPGYTDPENTYNHYVFGTWTSQSGLKDAAEVWSNPVHYCGVNSPFGTTNEQIRATLKSAYEGKGIKILVRAFGDE